MAMLTLAVTQQGLPLCVVWLVDGLTTGKSATPTAHLLTLPATVSLVALLWEVQAAAAAAAAAFLCILVVQMGVGAGRQQKKKGYTVCSSGYAATDTSWKKDAANSSALTVTQKEAEPQKNKPLCERHDLCCKSTNSRSHHTQCCCIR
jgi:hypothetical protein